MLFDVLFRVFRFSSFITCLNFDAILNINYKLTLKFGAKIKE